MDGWYYQNIGFCGSLDPMFRVGLDKIDNTGHEKMICPDLYRTIVEFVPLANLRLFSDASPIFDKVIKQVGRKIFYYRDRLTDLTAGNYVIIESQFGQKCILKVMKDCYNDITAVTLCSGEQSFAKDRLMIRGDQIMIKKKT